MRFQISWLIDSQFRNNVQYPFEKNTARQNYLFGTLNRK